MAKIQKSELPEILKLKRGRSSKGVAIVEMILLIALVILVVAAGVAAVSTGVRKTSCEVVNGLEGYTSQYYKWVFNRPLQVYGCKNTDPNAAPEIPLFW